MEGGGTCEKCELSGLALCVRFEGKPLIIQNVQQVSMLTMANT